MADEKITLTEKRFFKWYVDDISVSLRAKSGSMGGSEVFIIEEQDGRKADLPKNQKGAESDRL